MISKVDSALWRSRGVVVLVREELWSAGGVASGSTPATALLVQACDAVPPDRRPEALALAVRVMLSDGEFHAEELPALVAVRHALGLSEEEHVLVVAREVRRAAGRGSLQ